MTARTTSIPKDKPCPCARHRMTPRTGMAQKKKRTCHIRADASSFYLILSFCLFSDKV